MRSPASAARLNSARSLSSPIQSKEAFEAGVGPSSFTITNRSEPAPEWIAWLYVGILERLPTIGNGPRLRSSPTVRSRPKIRIEGMKTCSPRKSLPRRRRAFPTAKIEISRRCLPVCSMTACSISASSGSRCEAAEAERATMRNPESYSSLRPSASIRLNKASSCPSSAISLPPFFRATLCRRVHAVLRLWIAISMAFWIGVATPGQASKYGMPLPAAHSFRSSARSKSEMSGLLSRMRAACSARRRIIAERRRCGVLGFLLFSFPQGGVKLGRVSGRRF